MNRKLPLGSLQEQLANYVLKGDAIAVWVYKAFKIVHYDLGLEKTFKGYSSKVKRGDHKSEKILLLSKSIRLNFEKDLLESKKVIRVGKNIVLTDAVDKFLSEIGLALNYSAKPEPKPWKRPVVKDDETTTPKPANLWDDWKKKNSDKIKSAPIQAPTPRKGNSSRKQYTHKVNLESVTSGRTGYICFTCHKHIDKHVYEHYGHCPNEK